MSIRIYNKDHLREHAGASSVASVELEAPESGDPLVFWTKHDTEPVEVNLHPFSTGQVQTNHQLGGGKRFIPFTGRPTLILQLAPTCEEALSFAAKKTVASCMNALREWWRLLDAVEDSAAAVGQFMTRVEDVRLMTQIHASLAHSSGMNRQTFGIVRSLMDTTRMALGERQTFWEAPEDQDTEKHIPPKEQRDSVRFAVRGTCREVLDRWSKYDELSERDIEPEVTEEFEMWRDVKYMRIIQKTTNKTLPTVEDIKDAIPPWARNDKGSFKLSLRESIFPNHRDADAVWHQCLVNTGWNPSTLTTLDATKNFLSNHFKDDQNDPHRRFVLSPETYDYQLIGKKARAGGQEQFVIGQWKTLDGPGHLIKTYLSRVEPLRELLKKQLELEKEKYAQMNSSEYEERSEMFALIAKLEQGMRSVWLYVGRNGKVGWINDKSNGSCIINGKNATFMAEVIHVLNMKREAKNADQGISDADQIGTIPHLAPKDFRVWFANYVYRTSQGNMLHVQRALNHRRPKTANSYTNTNILNADASDSARRFLNILMEELDAGRVDLTILAHLHRYGRVTPEQELLLAQARTLPKSRMKVACKDARNPPPYMKATNGKNCDVQRCLLCHEHAVLLPESMDGIAMRIEELRALQGFLPIESWIEDLYDVELKNSVLALRKFDMNQGMTARSKWAKAIAAGEHYVPGLPLASAPEQMELI